MIRIRNLSLGYEGKIILQNLNAEVLKGEKVVFTGESGTGKTTLINALLGFVPFFHGEAEVAGYNVNKKNIQDIRSNIAYIPQELNTPYDKVETILYEPFTFKQNKDKTPEKNIVFELLEQLALPPSILDKDISEISGGQKQRIFLASAFLLNKPIIILDEPTTGLDENNISRVSEWLASQKNLTLLATSHNKAWIAHSDKQINLENYGPNH